MERLSYMPFLTPVMGVRIVVFVGDIMKERSMVYLI